jgi:hypothetical protein
MYGNGARMLLLCLFACRAVRCDAGEDVSPRDEAIVLAASHLGERPPSQPEPAWRVNTCVPAHSSPSMPRLMPRTDPGRASQPCVCALAVLLVHVSPLNKTCSISECERWSVFCSVCDRAE